MFILYYCNTHCVTVSGVIPVEGHCPGGDIDLLANHLVVGPMTRYAEDLPLMTRIMAGDNAAQLRLDQKVLKQSFNSDNKSNVDLLYNMIQ